MQDNHNLHHHQYYPQLTVVLFAKGRGSDAVSYRPNRDESQWWNRRDALVRCVASFLFGPSPPLLQDTQQHEQHEWNNNIHKNTKTLVILYDEDWSRMEMTYTKPTTQDSASSPLFVPSEKHIVSLWKQAAMARQTKAGTTTTTTSAVVSDAGLSCRLILPPDLSSPSSSSSPQSRSSSIPTGMDSKRDILEHLQKTCSMDFLRTHGLNSSMDVLLRKRNKKSILDAWQKWTKLQEQQKQRQPQSSLDNENVDKSMINKNSALLEDILREILLQQHHRHQQQQHHDGLDSSPFQLQRNSEAPLIVAGTLHESHEAELPCWDENLSSSAVDSLAQQQQQQPTSFRRMQICLFLGAVRDMYPYEYECIKHVVHQQAQRQEEGALSESPVVAPHVIRIRLGPVAEFTSKILTVLAFHHATGRLGIAVQKLLDRAVSTSSHNRGSNMGDKDNRHLTKATAGRKRRHSTDLDNDDSIEKVNGNDDSVIASRAHSLSPRASRQIRCRSLEVVCLLPTLESDNIKTDLHLRSRALWCLVRCTVTALWRSRVVSTTTTNSKSSPSDHDTPQEEDEMLQQPLLKTALTLVFSDGTTLRLPQDQLVKALAEQHQAAPCEYQILAAIEKQLKQQQQQQQQRHLSRGHEHQSNNKRNIMRTHSFWKECSSQILASIQKDHVDSDNGRFDVLDFTWPSSSTRASGSSRSSANRNNHNEEKSLGKDLAKHIYSARAAPHSDSDNANSDNMNGDDMHEESMTTIIALLSIYDDGSSSSPTKNGEHNRHPQQQQEDDNHTGMSTMMRDGVLGACRRQSSISVHNCQTFLSDATISTLISSSSSPSTCAAAASAPTHQDDCCQDREAAMIVLLQHFLYQNRRLVANTSSAACSSNNLAPPTPSATDNTKYSNREAKKESESRSNDSDNKPAADEASVAQEKKKKKKKHKKKKHKSKEA